MFQLPLSRTESLHESGFYKNIARDKHAIIIWAFSIDSNRLLDWRWFLCIDVAASTSGSKESRANLTCFCKKNGEETMAAKVWPCHNNVKWDVHWHHLSLTSAKYTLPAAINSLYLISYDFADSLSSPLLHTENQFILFHVWFLCVTISSLTGASPVVYHFIILHRDLSLNHDSYGDVAS